MSVMEREIVVVDGEEFKVAHSATRDELVDVVDSTIDVFAVPVDERDAVPLLAFGGAVMRLAKNYNDGLEAIVETLRVRDIPASQRKQIYIWLATNDLNVIADLLEDDLVGDGAAAGISSSEFKRARMQPGELYVGLVEALPDVDVHGESMVPVVAAATAMIRLAKMPLGMRNVHNGLKAAKYANYEEMLDWLRKNDMELLAAAVSS